MSDQTASPEQEERLQLQARIESLAVDVERLKKLLQTVAEYLQVKTVYKPDTEDINGALRLIATELED